MSEVSQICIAASSCGRRKRTEAQTPLTRLTRFRERFRDTLPCLLVCLYATCVKGELSCLTDLIPSGFRVGMRVDGIAGVAVDRLAGTESIAAIANTFFSDKATVEDLGSDGKMPMRDKSSMLKFAV